MYDTYFSQYCVRQKYISGSVDPFLAFVELIKRVYNPEKQRKELVSDQPDPIVKQRQAGEPLPKQPRILSDITNTLDNSLDEFM